MAPKDRREYQQLLAQEFLSCLEQKGLAWKKGWDTISMAPRNAVTGAAYHGVNQFYLGLLALSRGYGDPRWATMLQIMDKGGTYHPGQTWHLQKGSTAVHVEYWYPWDREAHKALPWQTYRQLSKEEQDHCDLRVRYTPVFNASMIDGIAPIQVVEREPQQLDGIVQRLSDSMGVELLFDGGNEAFYRPSEDKIHLPDQASFHSSYELASTALHELAHATGHESRLARPQTAAFGSPAYAYEELVAEIGSCFMGVDLEQTPDHIENHKAYVQSWIRDISDKPGTLISAIRDAQQAADYMAYHAGLAQERDRAVTQEAPTAAPPERSAPTGPSGPPAPPPRRAAPPPERPWSPVTRSGKLHFTDDQYRTARQASALEYARQHGYQLVKEGSRYHLAEHDSMIFLPDGQWHWNSRGLHGGAIELLTQYEGLSLPEAVLRLNDIDYAGAQLQTGAPAQTPRYAPSQEDLEAAAERPEFVLPPRAGKMGHVFGYLCGTRGLDHELVAQLAHEKRIYESVHAHTNGAQLHNVVFVGFDREGVPRSASLRGCSQASTFKREQPGSDKCWPFTIPGRTGSDTLYVFESAIDAASHATVQKLCGLDWQAAHRIALGGGSPKEQAGRGPISNLLAACPEIRRICICTDNDDAGLKLFQRLKDDLTAQGFPSRSIQRLPVPVGKDWNEYLQTWRRVVEHHKDLPTTDLADRTVGDTCGRIHFLAADRSVARTTAFTDLRHFQNAAAYHLRRSQACVVETPGQLMLLQRQQERRVARQTAQRQDSPDAQDRAHQVEEAAAEEARDRIRADGEPDLDKEPSREHRGFRDDDPPGETGQRLSMAEQLAAATRDADRRNAERAAQGMRDQLMPQGVL